MSIGGLLFLAIVLMRDYSIFQLIWSTVFRNSQNLPPIDTQTMDDDVKNEIERVKSKTSTQTAQSNLVLSGLSKFYGNIMAVNQLFVGVEPAECFGLLGVNGAGKIK